MSTTQSSSDRRTGRRPSTRAVAVGILLVSVVLAGIVSFYAASSPDGLTKVSQDEGFADTEKEHRTGDGPFAGYGTEGVDDERLSGGLAGVVGVVVVLVLGAGVAYAVRRRPGRDSPDRG
ncbi:PDGLE domain-containing protein [Nocardioides sp. SYSU D00038]|uniref:PDGLE domain-containing protein n=1 Tax=Nocardioides sp. SYSU D00038 TaxID=2812554 RepID=UPI001967102C|nr:PDGLE domain-containing protein [Nocardioides sp. SYSU D00038]